MMLAARGDGLLILVVGELPEGTSMRSSSLNNGSIWVIASLLVALTTASAFAEWTPGSGARIVRIDASNQHGSGFLQWVFTPSPPIDGTWQWRLPPGQEHRKIKAGADVIAEVEDLLLEIQTDPAVSLIFAVTAGDVDTDFTITSAQLNFPAITNPLAFATSLRSMESWFRRTKTLETLIVT